MLGWEYPPHISGGLGTACEGLTTALARHGTEIDFVVPRLFGGEDARHMTLVDSTAGRTVRGNGSEGAQETIIRRSVSKSEPNLETFAIPSLLSPYLDEQSFGEIASLFGQGGQRYSVFELQEMAARARERYIAEAAAAGEAGVANPKERYGRDIFQEVARFTNNVVALMVDREFDVIHAHDWMTYPAGVALSQITGKPLVVHVHSLEYDRSGAAVNPRIFEIERLGVTHARTVIAVSYYTMSVVHQQHGVPLEKIQVVHNGVYPKEVVQSYRRSQNWPEHVVLFLGRITFQKGPDYFVEAAARVIPHVPDVLFVMAGSGDMLPRLVNRVGELGIGQYFYFPGFLRGEDVERMFSVADLYVMPSVSEPFGISALEAISFDTPVIISRQSGVSEVLSHALKVDFWDLDRLADLMINALVHNELRDDMVSMAREEVKRLHWDAAALKTAEIYRKVL